VYLIRRNLTRYGIDELVPVEWSMGRPLKARNLMLVHKRPFDQRKRDLGADRPVDGETRSATKTL
jgi:O-methyltransferase